MECPRCIKEVKMKVPMKIDGHFYVCRLCGYKEPINAKVSS